MTEPSDDRAAAIERMAEALGCVRFVNTSGDAQAIGQLAPILAAVALDALTLTRSEPCPTCEGTGHERRTTVDIVARVYQPCPTCDGEGEVAVAPLVVMMSDA